MYKIINPVKIYFGLKIPKCTRGNLYRPIINIKWARSAYRTAYNEGKYRDIGLRVLLHT